MRSDIEIIKNLTNFLKANVSSEYGDDKSKVGLQKPGEGNRIDTFELVKPAVYEGWIPPLIYLDEFGYTIPGIIVMSDGGSDKDGEASAQIRLAFATYDMGTTTIQGGKLVTAPDAKGYYDLLNLMLLTRMKLSDINLAGNVATNNDYQWAMYDEQKAPFWHGWMTFSCPVVSLLNYIKL